LPGELHEKSELGPYVFFNTALVGFFALAGLLGAWQWLYWHRDKTFPTFTLHCLLCALTTICIVKVATSTNPEVADTAQHWRATFGLLGRATTVWLLCGLTGMYVRWYVHSFTAIVVLIVAVNTFVSPLNAGILAVEPLTLPWGEVILRPVREPAGWWVLPIYLLAASVDLYGLWGAWRLAKGDRSAGILVALASTGGLISCTLALLTDVARLSIPYLGATPYGLWVVPIALLILRQDAQRAKSQAVTEEAARAAAEAKRELAESARRETESLHRAILESSLDALIVMDAAGQIVEFNSAAETLFGYRRADVLGRKLADYIIPEDQRNAHQRGLERLLATGTCSILGQRREMQATKADGSLVHVDVAISAISGSKTPLFAGVVRDITARLAMEQQLRHSQKMQAIGQMAGGVAHDFNNLLTVIMGCSEVLLDPLPTDDPQREVIGAIQNASDRATMLTRQLLMLSRKAVLESKVIEVNQVIQNIATMLRRLIGENIDLTTSLAPDLNRIKSDSGQIEQVIMNLSLNARDAMAAGGRLMIETGNAAIDQEFCRLHPQAIPGNFIRLRVSDTGCGMTPEVRSHLFEPFFTTKGPGRGTGLGLATVSGIVEQSGGFIVVDSEVGRGTAVTIYLPVIAQDDQLEQATSSTGAVLRAEKPGLATVLLVEDEDAVRRVVRVALEACGYTVLEASSGPDAVQLMERGSTPVQLLVTDVVMPEMSGGELARLLRSRHPNLKVLFVSGYNEDALVRQGLFASNDRLLQKPFASSLLIATVQDVLKGPALAAG